MKWYTQIQIYSIEQWYKKTEQKQQTYIQFQSWCSSSSVFIIYWLLYKNLDNLKLRKWLFMTYYFAKRKKNNLEKDKNV